MASVCHIITRLIVGGAQENTILSCRGLVERGYDVTLLSGPETGPEGSLHEDARAIGCRFEIVGSLRRDPHPWFDARALAALTWRLHRLKPQIVHTHSSKAGVLGRIAARLSGVPLVIHTNHGLPFHARQPAAVNWTWKLLEMAAAPLADRLVCVGERAMQESIRARLAAPARHEVVYSGMETASFTQDSDAREELSIPPGIPVVGTVGRFVPQKAPDDFLDACLRMLRAREDVHVLWVGDGPDRPRIQAAILESGLANRFTLTGRIPPAQVPAHLRAMDVVAIPSHWEGLPRVAVQALLAGRPVVATHDSGAQEVMEDGVHGWIVPPGRPDLLADRALSVLSLPDRGRSMAARARAALVQKFDWRAMSAALDRLYRREASLKGRFWL